MVDLAIDKSAGENLKNHGNINHELLTNDYVFIHNNYDEFVQPKIHACS